MRMLLAKFLALLTGALILTLALLFALAQNI